MKLTTEREVNDFLAEKVMGFRLRPESEIEYSAWITPDGRAISLASWLPLQDLNHAFTALWKWQQSGVSANEFIVNDGYVGMYLCREMVTEEPVGPSAAGTARAICIALCRAHGAEVEIAD